MRIRNIPWTSGDAELINSDSRIKIVILDLVASKDELVNDLLKTGWKVEGAFKHRVYNTSVLVLSKQEKNLDD